MNKSVALLFICTFLVVGGVLYWAFSSQPPEVPPVDPKPQLTTMSYEGNSISEEKDGRKIWDLTAEVIEVDPDTKNMTLKKIDGVFYQEDGKTVSLKAPTAFYDTKSRDLAISGGVQAKTNDGATFAAEQVFWQGEQEIFYGEGNVQAEKDDTVLSGDRIETDAGMKKIKVIGNAHIVKRGTTK